MKKKLGSLLLTLCMLLALLPTSVLAADPADPAVTITEAGGTVHGYATVSDAFAAVGSYPNSTVKLMQDIAVTSQVTVASGTFTLDLNGMTWSNTATGETSPETNCTLSLGAATEVVITDTSAAKTGTMDCSLTYGCAVCSNGKLTVKAGTFNGGGVTIGDGGSGWVQGGQFDEIYYCGAVFGAISGGTFTSVRVYQGVSNITELLAPGYGYWDNAKSAWWGHTYADLNAYQGEKFVSEAGPFPNNRPAD